MMRFGVIVSLEYMVNILARLTSKILRKKLGKNTVIKMDLRIDKVSPQIRDAMWEGLSQGADVVAATARNLAPVSGIPHPDGSPPLKNSVVSNRIGKYKLPAVFSVTGYGGFVEAGTSEQPPQPFIRPALQSSVGVIGELVKDQIRRVR